MIIHPLGPNHQAFEEAIGFCVGDLVHDKVGGLFIDSIESLDEVDRLQA
jgi:hypothetical protein